MKKVFITVNPGFYNKGDAALVLGSLKTLRSIEDHVHISIASNDPEVDSIQCDADIIDISSMSPKGKLTFVKVFRFGIATVQHFIIGLMQRILRVEWVPKGVVQKQMLEQYRTCDIVVAGLDDSFTTMYGYAQFLSNCSKILIGKVFGKPVVMYASSIGPFSNKMCEIIGRFCLNRVDLITLREEISLKYIKGLGVKGPYIDVTADLAFVLPHGSAERAKEILALEGIFSEDRPLVGISLSRVISRWAFPSLRDRHEKYKAYLDIMAQMIDNLVDNISATVVFIPQVIGPTQELDDRIAARDTYELCRNKDRIRLIEHEYTPEELRAITGEFDMFIGTRTHSVISAAMMNTPFLALEYESHKTYGIIGMMLQCKDLVYDIKELSLLTLEARIGNVWNNRDRIRQELKLKTMDMEKRALRNGELVTQLLKNRQNT